MSLFQTISVTCPHCGTQQAFDAVYSVNADRRADLRDEILEDSFQFETCESCNEQFRLDPMFVYLDIGRGQWISAKPLAALGDWPQEQDTAASLMAESYGAAASAPARAVGDGLSARVTFGWPALREKIVVNAAGLDDVALELTKAALMRTQEDLPLTTGRELRLVSVADDVMTIVLVDAQSEAVIESMDLPIGFYSHIAVSVADFGNSAITLADGPFVDVQKLYIGDPDAPADDLQSGVEAEPEAAA
ncbi:MAG: hypothetical protein ACI8R4_001052 [Paracoccaceae bacterium]|jgi:hypothetical protein